MFAPGKRALSYQRKSGMINNRLYKIYQKKYKEKEFREKKKYGALYRAPEGGMLNIGEFLNMMEIKKGELPNVKHEGSVLMKLVDEQFNERLSNKQARSYQKAIFDKTGKEFSLHQLKSGAYSQDLWNMIKERRKSLMASGISGRALAHTISIEFFDSP